VKGTERARSGGSLEASISDIFLGQTDMMLQVRGAPLFSGAAAGARQPWGHFRGT